MTVAFVTKVIRFSVSAGSNSVLSLVVNVVAHLVDVTRSEDHHNLPPVRRHIAKVVGHVLDRHADN